VLKAEKGEGKGGSISCLISFRRKKRGKKEGEKRLPVSRNRKWREEGGGGMESFDDAAHFHRIVKRGKRRRVRSCI